MDKFKICEFNAQHVVPVSEYENHLKSCDGTVSWDVY